MSKDKARESITEALTERELRRAFEAQEKLEAPYERALGKLTIRFSLLHFFLERFSWEAWNLNTSAGSIVTKDLRISHLAEKLEASPRHVLPNLDDRKNFLSILRETKTVANKRNELLHSLWIIKEGTPVLCFSRTRGALFGPNAPSVEQINELCSQVVEILADFRLFHKNNPLGW